MKKTLLAAFILFSLGTTAQVIDLPGVNIEQDTVQFDLTPYMGMYVTETELQSTLQSLPQGDTIAITPQDFADFLDFAVYDSAYSVFPKSILNWISGDSTNITYVDNADTVWFQIDPMDFNNFLKWFNEYRTEIFPQNYDFGWGEIIE